jgi:heptosyltransferase-2
MPDSESIRLDGAPAARLAGLARFREVGMGENIVGVSPGAAYGTAKQWLPDRFAAAASRVALDLGGKIAIFGSQSERELCSFVKSACTVPATNFAGETTLAQFIEMAAACRVYLTNDSGAMHIASALGVPTVTVFGATDDIGTGPTGPLARIVREPVECSPCLKRECPIDHRCMTRIESDRVAQVALDLLK